MFCGCPCQAAALKRIVGNEDSKLIIIDFVCHGIPSQLMFDSYRQSLEKRYGGKITKFEFRNKSRGWHQSAVYVEFDNGKKYQKPITIDPYMRAFLSGTTMKMSCYDCGFKDLKSGSDIMLGDFWGAEVILKEWDDNTGISAVIVNSDKGKRILDAVNLKIQEVDIEQIIKYNINIIQSTKANPKRDEFFVYAQEGGFGEAMIHFYGESCIEEVKRVLKWIFKRIYYKLSGRGEPFY